MAELVLRAAAVLLAFTGLGFGIPCILGMRSLAAGQGVLVFMGFPTYGGGPFERMGLASTVPLLGAFLLVCVSEVVAAIGVWSGHRWGALLALAALVPGVVFWYGFALPIPPVVAVVRTALLAVGWNGLR